MDRKKPDIKKKGISQILSRFRSLIQAAATLLTNIHLPNFLKGGIYQGKGKAVCVPGLNCYSCPAASGACPIGSFQAVVGSSKFAFSYYITYSAGCVAGAIHLRLPVPVWLVSGVAAQNSDQKNFHKKAKGAYLHKICRFTHNGSFTARPCSQ